MRPVDPGFGTADVVAKGSHKLAAGSHKKDAGCDGRAERQRPRCRPWPRRNPPIAKSRELIIVFGQSANELTVKPSATMTINSPRANTARGLSLARAFGHA